MQKVSPFLWFDNQAEEAAQYYVSIFRDGKITNVTRYGEGGMGEPGTVLTVSFTLFGQEFTALNGGPEFSFTPAISFFVECESQAEVDRYWDQLTEDGSEEPCGWLRDKYGVSWQIVPRVLMELLQDEDKEKAQRVTQAMLQMKRIDIATLQVASEAA